MDNKQIVKDECSHWDCKYGCVYVICPKAKELHVRGVKCCCMMCNEDCKHVGKCSYFPIVLASFNMSQRGKEYVKKKRKK